MIPEMIGSVVVALLLVGCSHDDGGGKSKKRASVANKTFLAENVVLGSSMALAGDSTTVLDAATKVRPEQILLSDDETTVGRLKSKNLKEALADEVAPNLNNVIVGTWDVANREKTPLAYSGLESEGLVYEGTTGRISIDAEGSLKIVSGAFGISGHWSSSRTCNHMGGGGNVENTLESARAEVLGTGVIFLSVTTRRTYPATGETELLPRGYVVQAMVESSDRILLTTSGGRDCGSSDARASILTRSE